jgi:cob(I)alamin adenosyltransferase
MMFENYKTKDSVIVVYTGDGKGKTSASLGLLSRALGTEKNCAYIQFIKYWDVGEDHFLKKISDIYTTQLTFYKGGKGFYKANTLSAKGVSDAEHKAEARKTYKIAYDYATSGEYDLLICDEINNAIHDGLLQLNLLERLIRNKAKHTSLCLTGRNFPKALLKYVDIATEMSKLKHHFDDKFLANKGIDY